MNKLRLEIRFLTRTGARSWKKLPNRSGNKLPLFQDGLREDHGMEHMAGLRNKCSVSWLLISISRLLVWSVKNRSTDLCLSLSLSGAEKEFPSHGNLPSILNLASDLFFDFHPNCLRTATVKKTQTLPAPRQYTRELDIKKNPVSCFTPMFRVKSAIRFNIKIWSFPSGQVARDL